MPEDTLHGRRCRIKPLLWSCLVTLSLAQAVHANTLTKLRVVDSNASSQVILSATHPPAYRVIPLLERNLLVIHLADSATSLHAPLPSFTSPVIQNIQIIAGSASLTSPPLGASEAPGILPDGGVRVEVMLKTAEVTFTHTPLSKPPGLLLTVRLGKSSAKAASPGRNSTSTTPKGLAEKTGMALEGVGKTAHAQPAPVGPLLVVDPPGARAHGNAAIQQEPPRESSSLTMEEMKGLMGEGGAPGGALTLLHLYLNHRTLFVTNPSLLWQVAATYADLGLYAEAVAIYTRIIEGADNSLLQAAARVKQGKMALLRGDWAKAETLLQQFVKTRRHGPFLAEAYEVLGDAQAAQGKVAVAVEAYTVALAQSPEGQKTAEMFYKLGRTHKRAGYWLKAAEAFQKALERLQENSVEFRVSSVELTTAPRYPTPDTRHFSLEVAILQQLGESLYQSRQYQGAIAAYRRVIDQAPADRQTAWARYHLGKSYEKLGRNGEALRTYQELAEEVDPFWATMGQQALADMRWRGRFLQH